MRNHGVMAVAPRKEVDKVFGFRVMPGPGGVMVLRRQPRCKPCRSGKNGRRAVAHG